MNTMNKLAALAATSLLATLTIGCVTGTDESPADDFVTDVPNPTTNNVPDAPASFRPKTCQEIADASKSAVDGEYNLYIQGQPNLRWRAYCADLQTAPREYLTLATGNGKNTAMYAAGGVSPGTNVITQYTRVRINPTSLAIDIGDTTFATSVGSVNHAGKLAITDAPFGVAYTCGMGMASANVDLSGTPFHADDAFKAIGTGAVATYQVSADHKSVSYTVEGSGTECGFVSPEQPHPTLDPIADTDRFVLRLAFNAN
jgi:hypothetical protein